MKKSLVFNYIFLLVLTFTSAIVANLYVISKSIVLLIVTLAVAKFLIVAFQFMELKKANIFWKISLILTLGLMMGTIVILK